MAKPLTIEDARWLRAHCFFVSNGIGCGDELGLCRFCQLAEKIEAHVRKKKDG